MPEIVAPPSGEQPEQPDIPQSYEVVRHGGLLKMAGISLGEDVHDTPVDPRVRHEVFVMQTRYLHV